MILLNEKNIRSDRFYQIYKSDKKDIFNTILIWKEHAPSEDVICFEENGHIYRRKISELGFKLLSVDFAEMYHFLQDTFAAVGSYSLGCLYEEGEVLPGLLRSVSEYTVDFFTFNQEKIRHWPQSLDYPDLKAMRFFNTQIKFVRWAVNIKNPSDLFLAYIFDYLPKLNINQDSKTEKKEMKHEIKDIPVDEKIKYAALSDDEKNAYKSGFINLDKTPTESGSKILINKLWEEKGAAAVKEVVDKIKDLN